jgi:hypothetical protein
MPCRIGRKYHFLALVLDSLILLESNFRIAVGQPDFVSEKLDRA